MIDIIYFILLVLNILEAQQYNTSHTYVSGWTERDEYQKQSSIYKPLFQFLMRFFFIWVMYKLLFVIQYNNMIILYGSASQTENLNFFVSVKAHMGPRLC